MLKPPHYAFGYVIERATCLHASMVEWRACCVIIELGKGNPKWATLDVTCC